MCTQHTLSLYVGVVLVPCHSLEDGFDATLRGDLDLVVVIQGEVTQRLATGPLYVGIVLVPCHSLEDGFDATLRRDLDFVVVIQGETAQRITTKALYQGVVLVLTHKLEDGFNTTLRRDLDLVVVIQGEVTQHQTTTQFHVYVMVPCHSLEDGFDDLDSVVVIQTIQGKLQQRITMIATNKQHVHTTHSLSVRRRRLGALP